MFRFKALLRKTRDFSWLYKRSRNASSCEKSELKVEAKVVSQAIILFYAVFHLLTFWHFYKVTIFKAGIGIGTKTLMQCVCLYLRTCVFFTARQSETHCEQLVKKNMLEEFFNWRGWGGAVLTGKRLYPVYLLHSGGKLAHPFFSHRLSSSSHLSSWAASRWGKKKLKMLSI